MSISDDRPIRWGIPGRRRHRGQGRRRPGPHPGQRAGRGRPPATPTGPPSSPAGSVRPGPTATTPSWWPTPTSTWSTSPPPIPRHREQALLAIEAGKPVLIEKPVCLNAADTREVFDAAAAAGRVRHGSHVDAHQSADPQGPGADRRRRHRRRPARCGPRWAWAGPIDPAHRLYDLANGGGALLDLGIYPVTFAWIFLGEPRFGRRHRRAGADRGDATVGAAVDLPRRPGRPALVLGAAARAVPRAGPGHGRLDRVPRAASTGRPA